LPTGVTDVAGTDPFWLTLTNIVLGVLVVFCVLFLVIGSICETVSRLRRERSYEAELDHDMREMFPAAGPKVVESRDETCGLLRGLLEGVCHLWHRVAHRR
jgi:hypothetical protein